MKVNIDQTVQVSDEQRRAIARQLDGRDAKRRDATRDEMKDFIWERGSRWAEDLAHADDGEDVDALLAELL